MHPPEYGEIPLHLLREPADPHRLEMDPDELHRLADSMAAEGLHQAAAARGPLEDGTYEIIWGHRRLRAAQLLNWDRLHCRIYPANTDPRHARLDENNIRADLSAYEEARQCQAIYNDTRSIAATARYFRRSNAWVETRLELLAWPEDLREAVHGGRIGLAVARALASVDHEAYRRNLISEAERTGATAHTAEIWKQHWLSEAPRERANFDTVEQIVARREQWVYYVECNLCGEPKDFTKTKNLRMCPDCNDALLQLIEEAAAKASQNPA